MKLVNILIFCSNINEYYPRRVVVKLYEEAASVLVFACSVWLLLFFVDLVVESLKHNNKRKVNIKKNRKQNLLQKIQFLNVYFL